MTALIQKPKYLDSAEDGLFNANRHRENVEYLLELQRTDTAQIKEIMYQGFRHSIEEQHRHSAAVESGLATLNESLESVSTAVDGIAAQLSEQIALHHDSYVVLQEVLTALKTPRATEAAELASLAADNICNALAMSNDKRARQLLDESSELLRNSLDIHDHNAKAHFDFAWLCRNYLAKPSEAKKHFDLAALRAMGHDKQFAAFALRHLASLHADEGEFDDALAATTEAREIVKDGNTQLDFEHARYLGATGQIAEAIPIFRRVVGSDVLYYHTVETDESLQNSHEIVAFLQELQLAEWERCRKRIDQAVSSFSRKCSFATDDAGKRFAADANEMKDNGRAKPFLSLESYFSECERQLKNRINGLVTKEDARLKKIKQSEKDERLKAENEQYIREQEEWDRRQRVRTKLKWIALTIACVSVLLFFRTFYIAVNSPTYGGYQFISGREIGIVGFILAHVAGAIVTFFVAVVLAENGSEIVGGIIGVGVPFFYLIGASIQVIEVSGFNEFWSVVFNLTVW